MTAQPSSDSSKKTIVSNRKARRDYHILDKIEAGIELLGTEVKSIRAGNVSLDESHAEIVDGQVYLLGFHINPYEFGNQNNHEPLRKKRLLLHKSEIQKLFALVSTKGQTLIPLRIYLRHNRVKVQLALCKGKDARDKRETIKRKTADREAQRAISDAQSKKRR